MLERLKNRTDRQAAKALQRFHAGTLSSGAWARAELTHQRAKRAFWEIEQRFAADIRLTKGGV